MWKLRGLVLTPQKGKKNATYSGLLKLPDVGFSEVGDSCLPSNK